jgi:hypothetical protein
MVWERFLHIHFHHDAFLKFNLRTPPSGPRGTIYLQNTNFTGVLFNPVFKQCFLWSQRQSQLKFHTFRCWCAKMFSLCVPKVKISLWGFLIKYDILNVVEITNNMHCFVPLLYSIYLLLHVSAVVCHHQGALGSVWVTWNTDRVDGSVCCASQPSWARKHNRRSHDNPAHRPSNYTLYEIPPPIRSVLQVTQADPRSSLIMADYCRNM